MAGPCLASSLAVLASLASMQGKARDGLLLLLLPLPPEARNGADDATARAQRGIAACRPRHDAAAAACAGSPRAPDLRSMSSSTSRPASRCLKSRASSSFYSFAREPVSKPRARLECNRTPFQLAHSHLLEPSQISLRFDHEPHSGVQRWQSCCALIATDCATVCTRTMSFQASTFGANHTTRPVLCLFPAPASSRPLGSTATAVPTKAPAQRDAGPRGTPGHP